MSLHFSHPISFVYATNLALSMDSLSDDDVASMNAQASHSCPNCDGGITVAEHEHLGVCNGCYYGPDDGTH